MMPSVKPRAKSYWFDDVTISVFDVHTAIDAIAMGLPSLQEPFHFLADTDKYNQQCSSARMIETSNLKVHPLPNRLTGIRPAGKSPETRSKFWRGYLQIRHEDSTDPWKQQIPFVARPVKNAFDLKPNIKGVNLYVDSAAYVNTLGWSTNVRIRLKGRIKANKLVELVGAIGSKENSPWTKNGNPVTLTDVFRWFERQLGEEVYSPNQPPHPQMQFLRRWVISLNSYSGPLKSFEEMTDGEKDLFRSILYGKMGVTQNPEHILLRDSRPENFALVDFGRGILVFPQTEADKSRPQSFRSVKPSPRALHCHAENTRAFYVAFESLNQFLVLTDRWNLKGDLTTKLQACVNTTLDQLPQRCANNITNYFAKYHKRAPGPRMSFDDEIDLIRTDKLDGALSGINKKIQPHNKEMKNRVVMQSARLTRNTQAHVEGRITREAADVERTRIAEAILGLIRELEESSQKDASTQQESVSDSDVLLAMRQLETGIAKNKDVQPNNNEAIYGANNLKSISWIELGVRAAKSVCRVLIQTSTGIKYGTGFLIGPRLVITNNHVIASEDEARNAKIEFNYQLSIDSSPEPTVRYDLDPDTFFHTSPVSELDFSVIAVKPNTELPPLAIWGTLTLNADAAPLAHELVMAIQHPNGQVKQVVLNSSSVVQYKSPMLHYSSDTMPGSSGSPIFNDLWQVIAIHHSSGPVVGGLPTNEGIIMSAIKKHMGPDWPGNVG
jgi:V8-like Glu-specific endopeptidase